jgi:hypothetical protein
MKAEVKYWGDTDNLDLVITAETDAEAALLGLLRDRRPRWSESSSFRSNKSELIFAPADVEAKL